METTTLSPYDESILTAWKRCEICDVIFETFPKVEEHKCSDELHSNVQDIRIRRRDGLETLPATVYSSLLPYQTPQVKDILEKIFINKPPSKIVDCTCHIGGDALHFAEVFQTSQIIAIDIDQDAIQCLKSNVQKRAPFSQFKFIHSDCVQWIEKVKFPADLYYFDPPWGGPAYNIGQSLDLYLGDRNVTEIINFILKECLTEHILLKAPRNFSYSSFQENIKGATHLYHIKKPKKNNEIAYLLILITPE